MRKNRLGKLVKLLMKLESASGRSRKTRELILARSLAEPLSISLSHPLVLSLGPSKAYFRPTLASSVSLAVDFRGHTYTRKALASRNETQ